LPSFGGRVFFLAFGAFKTAFGSAPRIRRSLPKKNRAVINPQIIGPSSAADFAKAGRTNKDRDLRVAIMFD